MAQITTKPKSAKGNHIPDATIGRENIPAPTADPAIIMMPIMDDLLLVLIPRVNYRAIKERLKADLAIKPFVVSLFISITNEKICLFSILAKWLTVLPTE